MLDSLVWLNNSRPATTDELGDEALVLAAQANRAAFAALYHRYLPRVYRYALARLGDVEVAQDVTAQTFLGALEGLDRYDARGPFVAWLLRIAHHKVTDQLRRQRQPLPLEAIDSMVNAAPSLEEVVADRLSVEQVVAVLRTLSPDRATAVTLRLFGGLTNAEVAQVMGRREAAVKMLIYRALQDLQHRLTLTLEEA